MPPAAQAERTRTMDVEGLRMAIPSPDQFGLSDPAQLAWVMRQLLPHPLKGYTEPLQLQHPLGNGLPKTYIAVTDLWYAPLAELRQWARRQPDWDWREIAACHNAMVSAPLALASLLMELAGS